MDFTEVPQDINRNVMDALLYLQSTGSECFVQREKIVSQVKLQMRGLRSRNDIDKYIKDSLNNLTRVGVLAQTGRSAYAMRHTLRYSGVVKDAPVLPVLSTRAVLGIKSNERRLDPGNPTTSIITKESISGNNLTKARKRLRSNNKSLPVKKRAFKPKLPVKLPEASVNVVTIRRRKRKGYLSTHPDTIAAFNKAYKKLMMEELAKREAAMQQNSCHYEHPSNPGSRGIVMVSNNVGGSRAQLTPVKHPLVMDYALPLLGTTSADFNMLLQPNRDDASIIGLCGSQTRITSGFEKQWAPFWERPPGLETTFGVQPANGAAKSPYKWLPMSKESNIWN